ncbi:MULTISPECIES: pentapeptide repeat-containing protein [unclassified Mesobacillus]|uniref:pentapeptide repeat-containing protein n=1 Tax=unclassified Mesobacillus TaxID=2675270 RepID=UPI00203CE0C2|nr:MULTISPECIES: pentapeptide repeat-containing protein [unclassified Mesobacillus]MCM3123034.1 pentapeptide repeat-containing protein [Mesobacillus sp. MER 33]MCM3233483.1 pentapeptide repeat-containing protein [Mesobacillus sp. MER 48]
MTSQLIKNNLRADCESCFGLCCVALPYAKSADFPVDKESGSPCRNLQADFRCGIHEKLRDKGYKGCTVYECFGAGQKVSQVTYKGLDWRKQPEKATEMYDVFPIMQQLHEMLCYLNEAKALKEAKSLQIKIKDIYAKIEELTYLEAGELLALDIPVYRSVVNKLLLQTSELVRSKVKSGKKTKGKNLVGAKLRRADLKGSDFRGVLLIASDLREADLRVCDFIGADMRDADLSGANLEGSFFLTQAQINSAKGNPATKLPSTLKRPNHWWEKKEEKE